MTLHKNKTVYAQKATKSVHQQGQEQGENVSTVHLANAPPPHTHTLCQRLLYSTNHEY